MKNILEINLFDFKKIFVNIYKHLKNNLIFFLALIFYIITAFLLFNYYQYGIFSDGISYIGIAKIYFIGDFLNAINGYWGPLYSWLLIPFLFFGSTNLFLVHSAKILSLIIGFISLIGVKFLFSKFISDKNVLNAVIYAMIPIFLYFSFYLISPDLLILCILIFYLGIIFDTKYSFRLRNGILCGFLGALAYFSKSYAFIFFICHFVIFNLFFYFFEMDDLKKNNVKKNFILGLTVFLAISGIWIGLISDKYGQITIGTSGTYNLAVVGPESNGTPSEYQGLIVPPNKYAVSAWEDPSYFKLKSWNPLSSIKSFLFEINLFLKNLIKTLSIFVFFSVLSLLILLVAMIFCFKYNKNEVSKRNLQYLLITIIIYAGGYSLIFVEERYLWVTSILIFLLGVILLEILYNERRIKMGIRNLLLLFLIISFISMPISLLFISINTDNDFHDLSKILKYEYNVHGNIASNGEYIITLGLTYYIGGMYYGQTKKDMGVNELESVLKRNNIDYYFVWGNYPKLPYKEITNGKIGYLKVYSIKSRV